MTEFDAELYLRLMGERMMVDVERDDIDRMTAALEQAAAALIVGGAIDETRAIAISSEYALACELVRRPGLAERLSRYRRHLPAGDAPDLASRRVFTPDAVLSLAVGELRVASVTLAEGRTAINGVLIASAGAAGTRGHGSSLTISAGGTSASTHFSGDMRGLTATGMWECDSTFPAGTEWLDIGGSRLQLGSARPAPTFGVQAFSDEERLQRFLWLQLSGWGHDMTESTVEPAVAALRAAGLLEADDPGLPRLGWVRSGRGGAAQPGPFRVTGPLPTADVLAPVSADSPAAVLARARSGVVAGGTVGIGAVSPRFDGVMVAVDSLTIYARGVAAEVEVSGAAPPHRLHGSSQLGVKPISWWIHDELGNSYMGTINGASSTARYTRAKVAFGDLRDEPTLLTITVATPSAAAAIAIALEWQ